MTLRMTNHEVEGVTAVALEGRIVLGEESNSLREKLKSLCRDGKKEIVPNMARVEYIDSAGLGLGRCLCQRQDSGCIRPPMPSGQKIPRSHANH
jgi:anti-anti-sigma factor